MISREGYVNSWPETIEQWNFPHELIQIAVLGNGIYMFEYVCINTYLKLNIDDQSHVRRITLNNGLIYFNYSQ